MRHNSANLIVGLTSEARAQDGVELVFDPSDRSRGKSHLRRQQTLPRLLVHHRGAVAATLAHRRELEKSDHAPVLAGAGEIRRLTAHDTPRDFFGVSRKNQGGLLRRPLLLSTSSFLRPISARGPNELMDTLSNCRSAPCA
jgi:hypothetical protein